jgi:putative SOS response-associated peptidase YedK
LGIAPISPPWNTLPPQNYGGTEVVLYNLINEQVRQGHDVTVFAPGDARVGARLVSFLERRLDVAKWGLVPFFTKDLAKARKPINARSETVARSPLFKEAFARHRYLVPAAAYYEWRHDPSGKTPFAIARRISAALASSRMTRWTLCLLST